VPGDIVDSLLEDEQDFTPHVGGQRQVASSLGRAESEIDVLSGEGVAREPAHPLKQVTNAIPIGIDSPDDVAHRLDELTRRRRDPTE
jgi:hypothetical protein